MRGAIVFGVIVGFLFQWAHSQAFAGDVASTAIAYDASSYFQNGPKSFLGELQEFASSSKLGAEIYLPFGLGANAGDLVEYPGRRLLVNIAWTMGGLVFIWFTVRLLSLKVIGPLIYRKLNGEYDAQYKPYLEPSDQADVGGVSPEAVQPRPTQAAASTGTATKHRTGFGRR